MSGFEIVDLIKRNAPRVEHVPFARYDGPYGPAEVAFGPGDYLTRVTGPHVPTLEIEFGLRGRIGGGGNLRHPIACRLGEREGSLQQPNWGWRRRARAIHVSFPDREYRFLLDGVPARLLFERGGRQLATFSRRGQVAEWADPADVPVILYLLRGSSSLHGALTLGLL